MTTIPKDLELEIIHPTKTSLLNIRWIEIESISGNFTVGPDHSFLVALLQKESHVVYNSAEDVITKLTLTTDGFFAVNKYHAVLILDY